MIALALRSHDPERYRNDFIAILLSHGIGMGHGAARRAVHRHAVVRRRVRPHDPPARTARSAAAAGAAASRPMPATMRSGAMRRACREDSPPSRRHQRRRHRGACRHGARAADGPEREAFRKAGEALGFGLGSLFALIDPAPVAMVGHRRARLRPTGTADPRGDRQTAGGQHSKAHLVRHGARRDAAHPRGLRRAGADLPRPADLRPGAWRAIGEAGKGRIARSCPWRVATADWRDAFRYFGAHFCAGLPRSRM